MDTENDLYTDVERLLDEESLADDSGVKRSLVVSAISKAQELIRRRTDDADFHHLLGLAWYMAITQSNGIGLRLSAAAWSAC